MKTKQKTLASLALSLMLASTFSFAASNETERKTVGNVTWVKQTTPTLSELLNKPIASDTTSLFFVRGEDDGDEQSSVNIAVNDRFQVSLQHDAFTQVDSCSGINILSAETTGQKTNNLLQDPIKTELQGGQAYFFNVIILDDGQAALIRITKEKAMKTLKGKLYQSHQISRVIPNCPAPAPAAKPTPKPVAPVQEKAVLKEKVSMQMQILFDNDKAVIKPAYYNEVDNVANFMKKYTNSKAVIEGHTDSNAGEDYNQKLSESRAMAVKSMLIGSGIEASRLEAVGYGESRPIASNATHEGRAQNRRVIAVIEPVSE